MTTPAEWLRSSPRGAYTCIRVAIAATAAAPAAPTTITIHQIEAHVSRLASSCCPAFNGDRDGKSSVLTAAVEIAVEASARAWLTQRRRKHDAHGDVAEWCLMVTVLLPDAAADAADLRVHCTPMPSVTGGACVALRRGTREDALRKRSTWLDARRPLEAHRVDGVTEVVMLDARGCALEGLVSNLFVIRRGALYTARGDVLHGTARALVLDACAAAVPPLPVHFGAPRARRGGEEVTATESESESDGRAPRSLDEWDEAFLTSVVKLVQPIVEVRINDGVETTTTRVLPIGALTLRLLAAVQTRLAAERDELND